MAIFVLAVAALVIALHLWLRPPGTRVIIAVVLVIVALYLLDLPPYRS